MKPALAALIVLLPFAVPADAQSKQTFTGTISDGMCRQADHSRMRMGSTDAECTNACVDAHGAVYVLYDGKTDYTLSANPSLEKFAGQRVRVVGVLDGKTRTIQVDSIAPVK